MRLVCILAVGFAALAGAACDSAVTARTSTSSDARGVRISSSTNQTEDARLRVASRLNCPEKEGDLRLASAAADGRSCMYRSRDGDAEVELQLTTLTGPADAHLLALEGRLKPLVPSAASAAAASPPPQPVMNDSGDPSAGERAQVRLPGMRIDAQGERASIRLPGVEIDADGDRANVRVGEGRDKVTIRANDGGAEIRADESKGADGDIRSTYLLAADKAGPGGWRVAGYKAAGPGAGPLVIGVLRGRGRDDDDLMENVETLIERNVKS